MKKIKEAQLVKCPHKEGSTAKYDCLVANQNDHQIFLVAIPAEDLFPFCFLSRRAEDSKEGFQRILGEERALDIAKYLDKDKGSIATNVVLSAQESTSFTYDIKTGSIKYKRLPNSFLVIDGQHRLYGHALTKGKYPIPVAIYANLNRQEEAKLFIDINNTQKGVPAALLLDIKQVADVENEKESKLREIFDKLNSDSKSPLIGFLSPAENKIGKISRVTFNRAFTKLFDNATIIKLSNDKRYELVRNYFIALEKSIPDSGLLTRSVYFEAFAEIFEDTIALAYSKHKNYKEVSLIDILSPLRNIDLSNISVGGHARLTKGAISGIIRSAISNSAIQVTDDLV